MQRFKQLSISRRLAALVGLALLAMLVLAGILMVTERTLVMQERQSTVRQAVETAHGVLAHFHAQARAGAITEDEAKQRAKETLRALRYNGNEYFWINDMQPVVVMHPIVPDMEGKDQSQRQDPTGKYLYVEFVKIVKKDGGGFVDYLWPKPGSDNPVDKAAYVKGFAPWGWIVGSGVYVDTVQATFVGRAWEAAGVALLLAVLLALIGWAFARGILAQLGGEPEVLNAITGRISEGDLAVDIPEAGERSVLHGIATMRDSVVRIVGRVRQGSESVATASAEIAQGNHDLSARTEQQASALQQTAASMEELGSTVRQNADNARQANQLAVNASGVAQQGGETVAQVVETMKGINDSSNKIADIIGVIDGIAFQTNILALNAAVEAAREIKALISASVERVAQGNEQVEKAGATMSEVVAAIRRVTDIVGEISAASSEQSEGVSQVGEAVTQMDQATQQNAALVEQMAAAASGLKAQADELVQAVAVFRLAPASAGTGAPVAGAVRPAVAAPVASAPAARIPTASPAARIPAARAPSAGAPAAGTRAPRTPAARNPATDPRSIAAPATALPTARPTRSASPPDDEWESF